MTKDNSSNVQQIYIEDDEIKKKEELQEISCHQFSSNNRSNEQEIVELEDKYHKKINESVCLKEEKTQSNKNNNNNPLTSSSSSSSSSNTTFKINDNQNQQDSLNNSLTNSICSSTHSSILDTPHSHSSLSMTVNPPSNTSSQLKQQQQQHQQTTFIENKMSPGLAKRIASNNQDESRFISINEILVNKEHNTINKNNNSSNSNAQVKIQNALERNMQKLKLQSNKFNNGRHTASNLSREDIELFTSSPNDLKSELKLNKQNLSSLSEDSLASTPEHIVSSMNKHNEMTAYFLDRLPLPLNLNSNNNNSNQIAREMTPDSIDNSSTGNISECSHTAINSNKHRNSKHHMKLFDYKMNSSHMKKITPSCSTSNAIRQNTRQTANASKSFSLSQSQQHQQHQVIKKSTTGNQMKAIMKSTAATANAVIKSNQKQNYNLVKTNNQQANSVPPKKHLLKSNSKNSSTYMSDESNNSNNKIMPVVEEGLSNDELNEDDDEDDQYYEDCDDDDYDDDEEQTVVNNGQETFEDDDHHNHNQSYQPEQWQEQDELEEHENKMKQPNKTNKIVCSNSDHFISNKNKQQSRIGHTKTRNNNNNNNKNLQRSNSSKTAAVSSIYTSSSASSSSSTIKSFGPQHTSQNNTKCSNNTNKRSENDYDTDEETNKLLDSNNNIGEICNENTKQNSQRDIQRNQKKSMANSAAAKTPAESQASENMTSQPKSREINVHQIMDPDNQVLIEGVLFRARYLGSTQLVTDGNPTKLTRMLQAQEAVGRIKAPEGESQPSVEVDLFVSTEKIMVLNTDLQEIMMDHSLRSISYIADIGNLVVLMAKRRTISNSGNSDSEACAIKRQVKMICHVFESDEAQIVAQSIGQAFQVAYMEYLKANGIEDMSIMKDLDYQEVLNQQEIMGDELVMFARKECQKEVIIPKQKNEILGVVIVESGWGSMLPTVVVANMMPTGPAARCGHLNIGDQIISVNGISMVGLPLTHCQAQIKNAKHLTLVRLVVVPCPPVVEVLIKRPDTKYQLGFSVQDGIICSLLRGGIAERGGVRVGHRIIEINNQSVVATTHEKIVSILANSVGELRMKTMPTQMFRLLTGQEAPVYI